MIRAVLKSQYHAALKTLREVIEKCPEPMWNDPADGEATLWRVAYHTLFYAHFYLQQKRAAFTPWARHCTGAERLEGKPHKPYTREELLKYWSACDSMIDAGVDALNLSTPQCDFTWYKMSTLEHQIVNIRHIQHHAAALSVRLRRSATIAIGWVGRA